MSSGWSIASKGAVVLVLAVVFGGCKGNVAALNNNGSGSSGNGPETLEAIPDAFEPCTDASSKDCCLEDEMVCKDPDEGGGCSCVAAWVCDSLPNPEKCWRTPPVPQLPEGSVNAECVWSEFEYKCTGKTTPPGEGGTLPGGPGWTSKWTDEKTGDFESVYDYPPNPSNKPEGAAFYSCVVDHEMTKITCKPAGAGGTPRDNPTGNNSGPPLGDFKKVDEGGNVVWRREGGLPFSGEGTCNREVVKGALTIVCYSNNQPTGETGYKCEEVDEFGYKYRCTRPVSDNDVPNSNNTAEGEAPPGDSVFACVEITEFNRTDCYESPNGPDEHGQTRGQPNPVPKLSDECIPGTKMWCDGVKYCGWGQVTCKPDGTWPRTIRGGRWVIDCREVEDPATQQPLRPNTPCACYFWYFNPQCCKYADCIVRDDDARVCPASPGQVCDWCNPADETSCKTPGSLCGVFEKDIAGHTTWEAFCTSKPCDTHAQCEDEGFVCGKVELGNQQTTKRCVPPTASCYDR